MIVWLSDFFYVEKMGIWLVIGMFFLTVVGALIWFWTKKKTPTETPFLLLQQQLEGLRGDLQQQFKDQLDFWQKSQDGVGGRLDNAARFFGDLNTRMVKVEEISKQVLEVGKDISTLQQILKAPKLRGNFGEQLLADLLSQMMPQDNFQIQYTFRNGERVDAVIKTAQGLVSVDAKFPLENFQRFVAATTDEEKKNLRKLFINDVKKHVDDIASKYILPAEGTFEFALMYIPAENVYYEIITRDLTAGENTSILYHAMKKKVIPVSPNTFYAYLQTILLGLRGMQVEKRVGEIVMELARLRKELTSFRVDFSRLGKHLSDSLSSFEKSDKRLVRLEDKLSTLEILPSTETSPKIKDKSEEVLPLLEQ